MKILNLENEGNQEMLQEIRNRVDKYKLCFQEKIQGSQEFLPGGSVIKNLPAKAGDAGSISG